MRYPEIENAILISLYRSFFESGEGADISELRDSAGWDDNLFRNSVDRLSGDGLITAAAFGRKYKITTVGILHAEGNGIAPPEIKDRNDCIRTSALNTLADVFEQRGSAAETDFRIIAEEANLDENEVGRNIDLLEAAGYVESGSMGSYRITHRGLEAIEEWLKLKKIEDDFEEISKMSPQPRGRALQKLLARIFEENGWNQEEGVKTSNEEMDIIVFRNREYYLMECKWEKDPVEAAVVRELYGKLANRVDVRGIIISMSGFTAGAVKQAEDYAGQRITMLFGPEDVHGMIGSRVSFDNLLNEKYNELITRRKVICD